MTYTRKEYAEMAHKANQEGKVLEVVDGQLVLKYPPAGPEWTKERVEGELDALNIQASRDLFIIQASDSSTSVQEARRYLGYKYQKRNEFIKVLNDLKGKANAVETGNQPEDNPTEHPYGN